MVMEPQADQQVLLALDALKVQHRQKRDELARLEVAIGNLEALLGQPPSSPRPSGGTFGGGRPGRPYEGLGIADATVRYLRDVGRGASTREIGDQIRARGVETRSKNYTATVYAVLISSPDRVYRDRTGLWQLTTPEPPPADAPPAEPSV